MPNLLIIIASTRPGRVGLPIGRWFEQRARDHGGFDVTVADLAEWRLPFMDEPNHPRLQRYSHQHTKRWSASVEAADAFVFVMPEYNHGINAPLKNAIDYLHNEWQRKPVGFVSYGGVAAGTRAVQMTKQVVVSLRMVPLNDAVTIPFVSNMIDEDGAFAPSEVVQQSAGMLLTELASLADALRPLRGAAHVA
jgi:NAD(P)H-dependent FMN reductase